MKVQVPKHNAIKVRSASTVDGSGWSASCSDWFYPL